MGILENVLAKMQATPSFFPMSAETFSDWSIEAGDVVTVEVNGIDQTLPVFSADMDWGGAAMATLSCSGNRERPTLSKPERQSYAAFGGVSREIQKTNNKILEDRAELIAALNGEDGAPEDLSSGISNYVRYDLENNEAFAGSTLFAQIGEKAKAEIRVYTVLGSDGKAHSLADIVADQITLESGLEDAKTSLELKADKEAVDGALTAIAALNTRVGDAESSLEQKVSHTEFRDAIDNQDEAIATLEEAQTTLSSRVGSAEASLKLKASQEEVQTVDGKVTTVSQSVAELEADVISLKGRIDLSGQVSVSNGQLTVLGNLVARDSLQVGKDSFYIAGQKYAGKPITSTDNTEYTVLGA